MAPAARRRDIATLKANATSKSPRKRKADHDTNPTQRKKQSGSPRSIKNTNKLKKPKTEIDKSPTQNEASPVEKRQKRFRDHAPSSYLEKLHRATSQRMFVIDRHNIDANGIRAETFTMAGTTGNVYTVTVNQVPHCTCPDNRKGNQCKHIIYVLVKVLRASWHLSYQLAFLSTELEQIFAKAPAPILSAEMTSSCTKAQSVIQKPVEGDCPICFSEFEPPHNDIVFCRTACGNNIHTHCFEQWAKSQAGQEVRCVYCRSIWQGDEDQLRRIVKEKAQSRGEGKNAEGYINVAAELGLSGSRDYSTYHQRWVRQQGFIDLTDDL